MQDLGSWAGGRAWVPVVGALSLNCWTNREPQTPGNINQSEVSRRSLSQQQDPALPNCLQTPMLEASGQTTSKTGTQSHPSKNKKQKTKMRRQKTMLQIKEQSKNIWPNKWRGNKQLTWKRIQSNDSTNDPKSQKQNGGTDQENTRNIYKDL